MKADISCWVCSLPHHQVWHCPRHWPTEGCEDQPWLLLLQPLLWPAKIGLMLACYRMPVHLVPFLGHSHRLWLRCTEGSGCSITWCESLAQFQEGTWAICSFALRCFLGLTLRWESHLLSKPNFSRNLPGFCGDQISMASWELYNNVTCKENLIPHTQPTDGPANYSNEY